MLAMPELEPKPWALYGSGIIGGKLLEQVAQQHIAEREGLYPHPEFVVDSKGAWRGHNYKRGSHNEPYEFQDLDSVPEDVFPEYHFIALPSSGDEDRTLGHNLRALRRGKTVITAEKGTLANEFKLICDSSDQFRRYGDDAAAGGGTRIRKGISNFTRADPRNFTQIHLVVNGTATYLMSAIGPISPASNGISRGEAVEDAITLGFAEPPKDPSDEVTFESVLMGEAKYDFPKKMINLLRRLNLVDPDELSWEDVDFKLDEDDIDDIAMQARRRRLIGSIYSRHFQKKSIDPERLGIIGGFNCITDDLQIIAGFQDVHQEPLGPLGSITGPGNGALVGIGPNQKDGMYQVGFGPGAGAAPTVCTMLDNLTDLRIGYYW